MRHTKMNIRFFISIFSLFVSTFHCAKKFDIQNGIVVESIQATSSEEGYRPENVFISGKSWKPRPAKNPLDGLTIFFTDGEKLSESGATSGKTFVEEIGIECPSSSTQKYLIYVNGSFNGVANCGAKTPVQSIAHVIYLKPVTGGDSQNAIEVDEIAFYRGGKKLTVLFPQPVDGRVTASSIVEPKEGYPAYNLFDRSKEFGWVEGKPDDGIGEFIQIELDDEITLTGLEIYNGYQRSLDHFQKNGAVTRLLVSSGTQSSSLDLTNVFGAQRVFLSSPITGKNFKFTIEAVRTGSSWKDTAISELILLGKDFARFTVVDPQIAAAEKTRIDSARGSSVESLLGERFTTQDHCTGDDFELVFRPNGSFVIWKNFESTTKDSSVMDGNWILEKSGEESQLYIFGALYEVRRAVTGQTGEGPYTQNIVSQQSSTQIFSDRIKVSEKDMKGLDCYTQQNDSNQNASQGLALQGSRVRGLFTSRP